MLDLIQTRRDFTKFWDYLEEYETQAYLLKSYRRLDCR